MPAGLDHPGGVAAASARISELARSIDPTLPAPMLGRWKVRDVVAHLGGVQRWATRIVRTRSMDGPGFTKSKLDGTDLCDWFDEGAAELVDTLRATDPASACPNFNPGSPSTAAFWLRRQLHEATVHRWDVENAAGATTPIDRLTAADGVDEYLDVWLRTRGKQTLTAPLALRTTDPDRSWTLTPSSRPGRVDVAVGRSGNAIAELTGPAEGMLLHLWGRLTIAEAGLAVTGERAVAGSLRALER